ncbi:hypothetical protein CORC01_09149 [Colletotrichum orchidophilum]|uniref:Uncharacterized protein n=1 Tax=Colletotrichum orchidophilum TaxID=1209926 RepID=A0A1G4B2A3_9PEZI|nr:uncharacterized protein CORC01_09149 [Colletotrichum orchidophilum]OHE95559.1 hypothetical protein CORC01_09149 [Colletotrichum orchidophilum]
MTCDLQHATSNMRRCASMIPEMFLGARGEDRDGSPTMQHDRDSISSSKAQHQTGPGQLDPDDFFPFRTTIHPCPSHPIPSHRASALLHLINPKYGDRSALSILRDVSIGKDAEDDSFDRYPVPPSPLPQGSRHHLSLHRSQPPLHLYTHLSLPLPRCPV